MNFQKLFGPLTKSGEDRFFYDIIGHDRIKRLFGLALRSQGPNHILLSDSPRQDKMFLSSMRQHLNDSYFVDDGNTTKARIIDYLFKNPSLSPYR